MKTNYPIRADQFDVPLPFLLQQSAWLYEQQLSQVREQLRKAKPSVASGASPVPPSISGSVSAGGVAVGRVSSGGQLFSYLTRVLFIMIT